METKKKCACCDISYISTPFELCLNCYWEADIYQEENQNDDGGPNTISLLTAKENFKKYGACEERFKDLVQKAPFWS